jgi:predicted dehydrogenase
MEYGNIVAATHEETRVALRIIQVGIADWGATWAAVIGRSPASRLVARVDLNPVAGAEPGTAPAFASLEEALATVEADAVLIMAGVAARVPLALMALGAGKHVLLEQSFAPTLDEAETILAAADAAGCVLMIGQNYRFHPAPRTVAALVRGNILGAIGSISIDFRQNIALLPAEHALLHTPQPLLTEIAVHHFDLLRMILSDEATQVSCQVWNPPWSMLAGPAAATADAERNHGRAHRPNSDAAAAADQPALARPHGPVAEPKPGNQHVQPGLRFADFKGLCYALDNL